MIRNVQSDVKLFALAALALAFLVFLAGLGRQNSAAPPLSVRSDQRDGSLALRLWLEQSGYEVRESLSDPIVAPPSGVLFILEPLRPYSSLEATRLRTWVRSGNTLVVAGSWSSVNSLLAPFNVSLSLLPDRNTLLLPSAPTLLSPPVDKIQVRQTYTISTTRTNIVTHLTSNQAPVLISFNEGGGTIWVCGTIDPFTNLGLNDAMNARLILNLLARVSAKATISFDEAKHGFTLPGSVNNWLVETVPGWGVLLAVALTMLYLGLRGRRFGRAVPLPEDRLQREPVEYIRAIANLLRKSNQRSEIIGHYRKQLRRRLSERYLLDPKLSDVELVKTIVVRDPTVDEVELRRVLSRLSRPPVTEQELISTTLVVDDWLRSLN